MRRIGEIMEDIRGTPVCPDTGEENLYWLIQEHIEDGIFQGNRRRYNHLDRGKQE